MSIFTKPLSQLGTTDIQELLNDGTVENARLEFKLEVPNKDETLKKLSSFANTFGGFMLIGAKATSTDGRIEDLPGVDVQAGYKQKVVQWGFDGASPPLTVEVSDPIPTPAGNGKVCYVVYAAESEVAPHFLNGRKGIWVRTDEFSARYEARLADENELRNLFDRRRLILERRGDLLARARRRFDTYATRARTDRNGNKRRLGACLELCVVPRFPARPVCEHGRLFTEWAVPWRGVYFPTFSNGLVSQHESAIILRATGELSIFEANVWGMLYYGTEIEGDHNGTSGIHLYQFVGYVLVFIHHACKMLQALGYSGPILIETALASILRVQWLYSQRWVAGVSAIPGSELDNDVRFSITMTSEALLEKPDRVAMDVLRYIFLSVNWPDLVDTPQKLEDLVRSGYTYNSWREPANLRI